jgi:hypothetical protein
LGYVHLKWALRKLGLVSSKEVTRGSATDGEAPLDTLTGVIAIYFGNGISQLHKY